MNNMIDSFGAVAQRLARNPLGIIALFIVLVYGIAGLVFSSAATHLTPPERAPLIWFLVGFPVIVLLSFLWLVAKHHSKLYAPEDYGDGEGFFRAMGPMAPAERQERIEKEAQEIVAAEQAVKQTSATQATVKEYKAAEDLVVAALEQEFGVSITRHVGMGIENKQGKIDLGFDGSFRDKNNINYVLEVKYSPHTDFGARFSSLIHQIRTLYRDFDRFLVTGRWAEITYIFALVAERWSEEKKKELTQKIGETKGIKARLDIRFYESSVLHQKLKNTN